MKQYVSDIAFIAARLEGRINFSGIVFDQCLMGEEYREKDVNDIHFVRKENGVYFYTSKWAIERATMMQQVEIPVLVGWGGSLNLYQIQ